MKRIANFNSAPSVLPKPVLKGAQREFLNWGSQGASILEMSHRSPEFSLIATTTLSLFRELMDIPENYKILLLQGGASTQFSTLALNLMGERRRASYLHTGVWSYKALQEARKYGGVQIVASSESSGFTEIPEVRSWDVDETSAYLHLTPNETIDGLELTDIPENLPIPLVGDISSCILARPLDITRFGMLYASTQKNLGPAGGTVVIIREDLLDRAHALTPTTQHYRALCNDETHYNTPSTFVWYMICQVLKWIKSHGGLPSMSKLSRARSDLLYRCIDQSDIYRNRVAPKVRSRINVPFTLSDPALERLFLREAASQGLQYLNAWRKDGGMRASMYNAMPVEAVEALVHFMKEFEKRYR